MNTILLVEDNESIIMGLEYSLKQEGFNVLLARNLKEARDQENYDLVLLDITLPDGNGHTLFKEIKKKGNIQ